MGEREEFRGWGGRKGRREQHILSCLLNSCLSHSWVGKSLVSSALAKWEISASCICATVCNSNWREAAALLSFIVKVHSAGETQIQKQNRCLRQAAGGIHIVYMCAYNYMRVSSIVNLHPPSPPLPPPSESPERNTWLFPQLDFEQI